MSNPLRSNAGDEANKAIDAQRDALGEFGIGSLNGEWTAIADMRLNGNTYDREESYFNDLAYNVTVFNGNPARDGKANCSDYIRAVLAINAKGMEPTEYEQNDITKALTDIDALKYEGTSVLCYAIIASDRGDLYDIDEHIDALLELQNKDGGWGIVKGASDYSVTAMAIQAMAANREDYRQAIAIDKAVKWLSSQQNDDGTFGEDGGDCEATAQVLLAMYSLKYAIDYDDFDKEVGDAFEKNSCDLFDGLRQFYNEENNTFSHKKNGEHDIMATDQAILALTAVSRYENGESWLFDM